MFPVEVGDGLVSGVGVSPHRLVRGVVLAVLDIIEEGRDLVDIVLLVEAGQRVGALRRACIGRDASLSGVGTQRRPLELLLRVALVLVAGWLVYARRCHTLRAKVVSARVAGAPAVHLIRRVRRWPVHHGLSRVSVAYGVYGPLGVGIVVVTRVLLDIGVVSVLVHALHLAPEPAARRHLVTRQEIRCAAIMLLIVLLIVMHSYLVDTSWLDRVN